MRHTAAEAQLASPTSARTAARRAPNGVFGSPPLSLAIVVLLAAVSVPASAQADPRAPPAPDPAPALTPDPVPSATPPTSPDRAAQSERQPTSAAVPRAPVDQRPSSLGAAAERARREGSGKRSGGRSEKEPGASSLGRRFESPLHFDSPLRDSPLLRKRAASDFDAEPLILAALAMLALVLASGLQLRLVTRLVRTKGV